MKIRKRDQMIAFGLAGLLAVLSPREALAFEPWSNVNGYWISADGRSTVEGALKKGVTLTKYQNTAGDIDWGRMSQDDVSFAMVRLGYLDDPDPYFKTNMTDAETARFDVGVCFYGKATTVEEARKEAAYVLDMVKKYRITYPIAYDVDAQYVLEKELTRAQITDQVEAFCKTIEDAGYKSMIFGDHEWLTQHLELKRLPYDIWYSRYGMAHTFENRTMWRCTDSAQVKGIEGSVCLEFAFADYKKTMTANGWRTINGKKYYFRNYKMVRNTGMRVDNMIYFFDEEGNLLPSVEKETKFRR